MSLFDDAMGIHYPQFGFMEPGINLELPGISEPTGPDIYTNEDNKTRVYDKTDKLQTNPSCYLQSGS